jgi:hypothetical protein
VFEGRHLSGYDKSMNDVETAAKLLMPFTDFLKAEVEEFYFSSYAKHFGRVSGLGDGASVRLKAWEVWQPSCRCPSPIS